MLVPFAEDYVNWLDGKPSRLTPKHDVLVAVGLCAAYGIWLDKLFEAKEPGVMRVLSELFFFCGYGETQWPFVSPGGYEQHSRKKNAHLNPVRQQFVRRLAQLTETCMDDYGNIVFKSSYVLSDDFVSGFEFYGTKLLRRSYA